MTYWLFVVKPRIFIVNVTNYYPETSSSVVCGAKERTDVGAELGTDDLVGAELGEVRNSDCAKL